MFCGASVIGQSPHTMAMQLGVTLHQPGSQVTKVMARKHISELEEKVTEIISHLHIHLFFMKLELHTYYNNTTGT